MTETSKLRELPGFIQEGHYGKVTLIQGTASALDSPQTKQRLLTGLLPVVVKSVFSGDLKSTRLRAEIYNNARRILFLHAVGKRDVNELSGISTDQKMMAYVVGSIISLYLKYISKKNEPYTLGRILSDFHEVAGPQLSSSLLLASYNPKLSADISDGKVFSVLTGIDLQPHAVETFLLLPRDSRLATLEQMSNSNSEDAGMFQRFVSGHYFQNRSLAYGFGIINKNLGKSYVAKDAEIREELSSGRWSQIAPPTLK